LLHLARKGVPVATPVERRDGGYTRTLAAPEGDRQVVLYTYAPGEVVPPDAWNDTFVRQFGRAMATMHVAAGDFMSKYVRSGLDIPYLLGTPLQLARQLFVRRPDDRYGQTPCAELAHRNPNRAHRRRSLRGACVDLLDRWT
jgi:Ser/Thr protein kinase RdoA (MazF antagonist)